MPTKKEKLPAKKVAAKKRNIGKETVKQLTDAIKPSVLLTSYSIKATIPVMQYGNLIPEIVVTASSMEEAHAAVMPFIENLFELYAEAKPKFLQKAQVTVQEKMITPTSTPESSTPILGNGKPVELPVTGQPNSTNKNQITNHPISFDKNGQIMPLGAHTAPSAFQDNNDAATNTPIEKSIHYQKAENAVHNSFTIEALDLVQSQITASVKLDGNDKNHLYTLVLKKRAELNHKL